MSHSIFLSHNFNDKPLVEPVATRLAEIVGQDEVFYDSWSIRPGDGIIERMNQGLTAPSYVFFFVSKNSLASAMVKLEWQNALYAASKGKTRVIPVRVDGCEMPAILMQTLYIDMHTIGLEAAITQIINVIQGNASFTPQHLGFSNLTFSIEQGESADEMDLVVRASHLMEPNLKFLVLVDNADGEVNVTAPGVLMNNIGFNEGVELSGGLTTNGFFIQPVGATLSPSHPVRLRVLKTGNVPVTFRGLLHEREQNNWFPVPQKAS